MKIYRKVKKTVQIIFWAVFLVVVLVGIFSGWDVMGRWLAAIASGLAVLLYGGQKTQERINEKNQEIQEKEKEIDQAVGERRQRTETLIREDEKQQAAIEAWRKRKNRWKSRGSLMLILCMLLVVARPAWAGVEDRFEGLSREELIEIIIEAENLLDEADQLLTREIELKEYYKQLYLEVEADLRAVRELSGQKDEIIASLEKSNRAWGVVGGVELGNSFQWRLGVARKKGIISFGAGIGGGDGFSVWGEVGLWAW